jgi:hypothetical protein
MRNQVKSMYERLLKVLHVFALRKRASCKDLEYIHGIHVLNNVMEK